MVTAQPCRQRTFLRHHLVAWLAAAIFALPSAFVLVALAPPNFVWRDPATGLPRLVCPTLVALVLFWRLAVALGPDDLLTLIPATVALALSFGLGYSADISAFLPDDGHTFFDVQTFGAPPFDFFGQLRIFSCLFLWCWGTAWGGIALKRKFEFLTPSHQALAARQEPDAARNRKLKQWLAVDLAVVASVTLIILGVDMTNRIAQGRPGYLIQTLQSPGSSTGERLHAIWELSSVQTDEATQALRQAAQSQPPPVNVNAAATLLERGDISGLPLLGDVALRHPSDLVSQESAINLQSYLGSIKDPAAIPVLLHLMTAADAGIRRGAAQALGNTGTTSAIAPLVQALDDGDQEVRYYAVIGLAKLNGKPFNGWYPFQGLYVQNEAHYLDHWKTWANERTYCSRDEAKTASRQVRSDRF